MSLIHSGQLRARAQQGQQFTKSAGRIKLEAALEGYGERPHDIFLSHSKLDEEEIYGLKLMLEDYGHSVYIDWIDDPHLDREEVSKETAALLRARMKSSRSLLYVTSENSVKSKWTPWELGFKDGSSGRAAVLPVATNETSTDAYDGVEYLALYPYLSEYRDSEGKKRLWINWTHTNYIRFDDWLDGEEPYQR
ncbi:TIR domain-containing protein [Paraburkholderia sp. BL6669N2]|uniref:toll/interleukin-1 receptor domain-containing protein n=1 Tax=Paraburkholderia sp. BL6669N2 TaxID=1938807 RepID=UPI000E272C35|nr:toll/interleukin-1 receptor domain-containing protein [Paraburkholderia sp. BL6669N2]REG60856.1 TIR domain-containing protein [Paraburkholderia sp. BL6669N2]